MEQRWEFCPHCGDGFPTYIDANKTHHRYSCTSPECEAFFQVKRGEGNFDKREGMKLSPEVVYYHVCDGCDRMRAVKVKNNRLMCRDCFKNSKLCVCECRCS